MAFGGILYAGLLHLIIFVFSLDRELLNVLNPLKLASWIPFFPHSWFIGLAVGSIYMALMFGSNGDFGRDDSDGI